VRKLLEARVIPHLIAANAQTEVDLANAHATPHRGDEELETGAVEPNLLGAAEVVVGVGHGLLHAHELLVGAAFAVVAAGSTPARHGELRLVARFDQLEDGPFHGFHGFQLQASLTGRAAVQLQDLLAIDAGGDLVTLHPGVGPALPFPGTRLPQEGVGVAGDGVVHDVVATGDHAAAIFVIGAVEARAETAHGAVAVGVLHAALDLGIAEVHRLVGPHEADSLVEEAVVGRSAAELVEANVVQHDDGVVAGAGVAIGGAIEIGAVVLAEFTDQVEVGDDVGSFALGVAGEAHGGAPVESDIAVVHRNLRFQI